MGCADGGPDYGLPDVSREVLCCSPKEVKSSDLSALGDEFWRAYANSQEGFWPALDAALRAAVRLAGGEVEEDA